MFVPMSSGSIFLRRFAKKETERKRNSDAFQGRRRRKKMMRTKSNVNAFVFGEEARRDFGEEKEKNEEGGGGTITMKSIESNVSKLERMTPVFSRELMAFVSGNKSELYEKRRKRNVAEAVVAKRGKEEDFRQPTSQFLSVFSVGSRNSSGSENMVLSLTDESCIQPSELAKKHFPAVMNAMREVNGMNVRVVALRPSYRYEEKKKKKKMKTSKTTKKNSAENDDDDDDDDDDDSNTNNNNTRRNYYLEEIIAKSNRLNRRSKPKRFPLSDSLYTAYACLSKDADCDISDVGVEAEFLGHPVQKMPLEVGEVVCVDSLARSRMFNAGEAILEYNEEDEEEEQYEDNDDDDENEHRLLRKNIFAKAGKGCVVLVFDLLDPKYERNGTALGIAKCVEEMTRVFGNEKSSAFEKLAVSIKCNLS
jgi:hypothetical protein